MEMTVVFWEGHCSLFGKIMRTIFHSIKLLHLAQLATHTKVKERDPFLYDTEECQHETEHKQDCTVSTLEHRRSFIQTYRCNLSIRDESFLFKATFVVNKGLGFILCLFKWLRFKKDLSLKPDSDGHKKAHLSLSDYKHKKLWHSSSIPQQHPKTFQISHITHT